MVVSKMTSKGHHINVGKDNPMYGVHITLSPKRKEALSKSRMADMNPMWKGDRVSYNGLHGWVRTHLPKPEFCQDCGVVHTYLDLTNISGKYLRDLTDWKYLCRRCHMVSDGRFMNLKQFKGKI